MEPQPDRPKDETLTRSTTRRRSARQADDEKTPAVAGLPARRAAARLLAAVIDRSTPLDGLTDNEHGHPDYLALDQRDRALVRAILNAGLRFKGTLEAAIASKLDRPLPANAATLAHILHVGATQILLLDIPDSAAVDLAVSHAKADPRTRRFSGLVNAVLRALARDKDNLLPAMQAKATDATQWLMERLDSAYGKERRSAILASHRLEPCIDFTVKDDPAGWAERLGGLALPTGTVRVLRPQASIGELPGYGEGEWWIQDAAAALPARLLGDVEGLRIADLCAAPGGKTAQLAHAGAKVTAIEMSANRARRLAGNLARLGLEAEILVSNLLDLRPEELYDAVLLDAPCSSTGTIRRHPDVAWTKTPQDIEKLAGLQARLLDHAGTLVRPGGLVVFANCSLDPMEGEAVVAAFLSHTRRFERVPVHTGEIFGLGEFIDAQGDLRTTPDMLALEDPALSGLDGFFAARLRRVK